MLFLGYFIHQVYLHLSFILWEFSLPKFVNVLAEVWQHLFEAPQAL